MGVMIYKSRLQWAEYIASATSRHFFGVGLKSFDSISLKTRVTLFMLVIFVAGIWALSLYSSRILRDEMQQMLGEQQFSTVSAVAGELSNDLRDRTLSLEAIAKQLTPSVMADAAVLQALLEQRPLLPLLFNGGVWVARADGIAVADIPRDTGRIGTNYSTMTFIANVLKEGKTSISPPLLGKKRQTPVIALAVPIRDAQGRVAGVLTGVIDLDKSNFLDKITQNHYGRFGGYVLVSAKHRTVITATDKSRIMEVLPAPGLNPWVDRFAGGYEGSTIAINPKGTEVLVSGKGVPDAGWYVLATLPVTEAFAPIESMLAFVCRRSCIHRSGLCFDVVAGHPHAAWSTCAHASGQPRNFQPGQQQPSDGGSTCGPPRRDW